MSRNQNSHFSLAPQANIKRSRFDMSHSVKTTFNAGKLVPFELKEILPGDTFDVDTSILARMQTLTVPIMDNIYIDTYYFFVPSRLLWKNWQRFMGESDEPWFDETQYSVPTIEVDIAKGSTSKMSVKKGTVADYLGMPLPNPGTFTTSFTKKVNHLPIRAYVKIWNDWFRNENLQSLATFNTEDISIIMDNTKDAWYGGELLPVNRYKDYFSSGLVEPQRGPETVIGIGQVAPVFATDLTHSTVPPMPGSQSATLQWEQVSGSAFAAGTNHNLAARKATSGDGIMTVADPAAQSISGNLSYMTPNNLWSDISAVTGISINDLRMAFATQRFYEQSARGGNRYIELLANMFQVTNGDLRLQRSEYLGGTRLTVQVNQALQQSETQTTPLGNIGAYSLTTDHQKSFVKSFSEHGYLLGVMCARYDHSYSQGYDKLWLRKDKFDYYFPQFANIGEQPIPGICLFADGSDYDDEVFAYQEAWAEYRYANNILTGEMRPVYDQTLDFWHLGDYYETRPYLSDEWICENGETIDRTLAVSSNVSDQFLVDMYITTWATRPMPLFSVPGLDVM